MITMAIIIFVIMMSMIIIIMMLKIIIIMMMVIIIIIKINGEYREIFKGVAATGARIWWWAGAALELTGDGYHDHNDHYGYDHDHGYNDHNVHNDHYDHYGGDGDSNGGWNDEQVQHSNSLFSGCNIMTLFGSYHSVIMKNLDVIVI